MEDELFLPSNLKDNVSNMIKQYLTSKVDKNCQSDSCKCNRYHSISKQYHHLIAFYAKFTDDGLKKLDKIDIQKTKNIFNVNYSLLGVVHHAGSTIKSGHYYCTVKYSTFLDINDDRVTSQQMSELKSNKTAHILFYQSS